MFIKTVRIYVFTYVHTYVLHVFYVTVGATSHSVCLLCVQYREGADLVENEDETCHIRSAHKML